MKYAQVALSQGPDKLFDYSIPEEITNTDFIGRRVSVPFGKRTLIGYIVGLQDSTKIAGIRPINKLLDSQPILTREILQLTKTVAGYYCGPWGQAIHIALPNRIRQSSRLNITFADNNQTKDASKPACTFVWHDNFEDSFEFCLKQIQKNAQAKKTAIILSPEVNYALKLQAFLKEHSSLRIETAYRKQRAEEELHIWEKAINAEIDILIGTRAAVFMPLANLGLIIALNEDSYGYKEQRAPYYYGPKVALMRAQLNGIPLYLTAQVPSLDTYYAVKKGDYSCVDIRRKDSAGPIKVSIIDMRGYGLLKRKKSGIIPIALEDKINSALKNSKKVLIFINKKGHSRYIYCKKCGYVVKCGRCSLHLTYYAKEDKLICNSCGFKIEPFSLCPKCGAAHIEYLGYGSEKVASTLHLLFPQAKINHIDKEYSTSLEGYDIIAATEALLHRDKLDKFDLTVILDLDSVLNIIDFRSNEKIYSLLYRLKSITKEELVIQTGLSDYFSLNSIRNFSLDNLYDLELKERKALKLPPFMHLAYLSLKGEKQEKIGITAAKIFENIKNADEKVIVFAPLESVPFKSRGSYSYKILLKAKKALLLGNFIRSYILKHMAYGAAVKAEIEPL